MNKTVRCLLLCLIICALTTGVYGRKLPARSPRVQRAATAAQASSSIAYVEDSVLYILPGVTKIKKRQFADRTDFKTITFQSPCLLSEIGEYAFLGCTNLEVVILPASVKKVGIGTFRECSALKMIDMPGVTKLPEQLLSWCTSLKRVKFSKRVADIGSRVFAYCESLDSVQIPATVKHIGTNAFSFCKSLQQIELPASITELESYAFSECTSLKRAVLPGNSHLLGELIFSGCRALESIEINSAIPPKFDCNSFLFEDGDAMMYDTCKLLVPNAAIAKYKEAHAWKLFKNIIPISAEVVSNSPISAGPITADQ